MCFHPLKILFISKIERRLIDPVIISASPSLSISFIKDGHVNGRLLLIGEYWY